MTRTTAILATGFFLTSLALGLTARYGARPTDVLDRIPATQTAPAGSNSQGNGASGNLLDQLGGMPNSNGVPVGGGVTTPAGTPATADPAITPSQNTTTGPTMETPNQPVGGVPAGDPAPATQPTTEQTGQATPPATVVPATPSVEGAPASSTVVPNGGAETPATGQGAPAQ